jgi:diguanylate cyclase (GGDEF)-like protein
MVDPDDSRPRNIRAFHSITIEIFAAFFVSTSLTSLLIALCVSVVRTTVTTGELWQLVLSVTAVPTVLTGAIIALRVRQTLTRIRITHEELVNLARIDGVTGLLNRPGFDAVAAEAIGEARQAGHPISALLCDIDSFRGLNDRYGPEAGDLALRNFAEVLEESIGGRSAIVARHGSDEFVILLLGIDLKDAVTIAEDLRGTCEARALIQRKAAAKFTISVGVGTEASDASELRGLFRRTDAALYQAKRAGGNQVATGSTPFNRRQSVPNIERSPRRSANQFVPAQRGV